jgi:single-stranded-DNA-specific exonuclease
MVGCRINTYIPDRITEGYGLNEAGLRAIKDVANTLVITVEVTAIKEAKLCRELGMDLIVTDHALNADGILSEAIAVVNPHIPSPYPFANLCGAGGAFALLVATRKVLRERGFFKRRPEPRIADLLQLVALATIGHLVERKNEKRLFVTHGLKTMYSIPGLKALAQVAFRLAPRINASGRMDSAAIALELLITEKVARRRAPCTVGRTTSGAAGG